MTWAARIPTLAGLRYPQASFVLDFANNYYRGSGAQGSSPSALPGYNFTRALAAYAEDTAGNLIQFASGAPRITNKGVLIEESRTNLLLWSQDFTNAAWGKADTTVTADQALAPDGTATADLMTEGSAGTAQVNQAVTITAGQTLSVARYFKRGNTDWVLIKVDSTGGANGFGQWFNLSTGAKGNQYSFGTGTFVSATITQAANGFYRCIVTGTVDAAATTAAVRTFNTNGNNTETRVSGATRYEWQADLQAATFITSPIPTTSASVTRPADVFYFASGTAPLQNAMTFVAQTGAVANTSSARWMFQTGADTTNNRIGLAAALSATTLVPRYVQAGNGKSPADITGILSVSSDNAAAIAYSIGGNVRAAANGLLSATPGGDPVALPSQGNFNVGADNAGSNQFNGYIKRIVVYPFAATDAQLQSLSSGNF